MQIKELGEFSFINSIAKDTIFDAETVKVGIGDDCAVYTSQEDMDQLITTDTMVDGVHFSMQFMRPYDIGYRLMAANISDIAAMGGTPKQVVISIAIPKDQKVDDLQGIYDGIKSHCREYNINLIGGDTVATSGPLILTATVIGEVKKDQAVLRSKANIGDWVGVTNTLGLAAVGLDVMAYDADGYFAAKAAFQRPKAQVKLGHLLRSRGVSAMNDISDGLASELQEIAKASRVHIIIDKNSMPYHKDTLEWGEERGIDPIEFALFGGEDFQLVFTVNSEEKEKLEEHPLITFIGRVIDKEPGLSLFTSEDEEPEIINETGYKHFES